MPTIQPPRTSLRDKIAGALSSRTRKRMRFAEGLKTVATAMDQDQKVRVYVSGEASGVVGALSKQVKTRNANAKIGTLLIATTIVAAGGLGSQHFVTNIHRSADIANSYRNARDQDFDANAPHPTEQVVHFQREKADHQNALNGSILASPVIQQYRAAIEDETHRSLVLYETASASSANEPKVPGALMDSFSHRGVTKEGTLYCKVMIGGHPTQKTGAESPEALFNTFVVAHEMAHCVDDDSVPGLSEMGTEAKDRLAGLYRTYLGEARADMAGIAVEKIQASQAPADRLAEAQDNAERVARFVELWRMARWNENLDHYTPEAVAAATTYFSQEHLEALISANRENPNGLRAVLRASVLQTKLDAIATIDPGAAMTFKQFSDEYFARYEGFTKLYVEATGQMPVEAKEIARRESARQAYAKLLLVSAGTKDVHRVSGNDVRNFVQESSTNANAATHPIMDAAPSFRP